MNIRVPGIRTVLVACMIGLLVGCAGKPVKKPEKENVIVIDPAVKRQFEKAVALLDQEMFEQAAALLEQVVEKEKRFAAPYANLGIAYARTDKTEPAEQMFKKAMAIKADHVVAGNELGLLYRKQGRFKEAKSVYETVLAADPDYMPAIKNLGILCDIYLRDYECALKHYTKYKKLKPKNKKVGIWIADLKNRLNVR